MSENSSSSVVCRTPSWLPSAIYGLVYNNYYVMPLFFVVASIVPGFFTAVAFCRLYRKEIAYVYQRIYIVHMFVQSVFYVFFFLSRRLSGWGIIGVQHWFRTNYFLMWYAARLASPVINGINLTALILMTSMAYDRFLAVTFPIFYHKIKRLRMAAVLVTISYTIGLGASLFDLPRLQLQRIDDEYRLVADSNYTSLLAVQVFSNIRNGLDMLFALLLALLNIVTVTLFVRQSKTRKLLMIRSQLVDSGELESRRLERNLLILTVSQSFTLLVEQPLLVSNFFILYASSDLISCYYPIVGPMSESASAVFHAVSIIQLYIINRPFSQMLRRLPFVKYLRGSKTRSQQRQLIATGTSTVNSDENPANKLGLSRFWRKIQKWKESSKRHLKWVVKKRAVSPAVIDEEIF